MQEATLKISAKSKQLLAFVVKGLNRAVLTTSQICRYCATKDVYLN